MTDHQDGQEITSPRILRASARPPRPAEDLIGMHPAFRLRIAERGCVDVQPFDKG